MSAPSAEPSRVGRLGRTGLSTAAGLAWTVRPLGTVPERFAPVGSGAEATVPGEIHTDLLRAGLVPDPFDGDNEPALAWIGRTDWEYRTTFTWAGGQADRHDLVADGLDTVAVLELNGTVVGRTANQHRAYRFDVRGLLVEGPNELVVRFEGPVSAAERLSAQLGDRPRAYPHPFNAIRKMAAAYGWDWGIDAAGVGIWKDLRIESWTDVRIAAVRPLARLEGADGLLECHVDLEWAGAEGARDVDVTVTIDGRSERRTVASGATSVRLDVRLPQVRRWWPAGYGEPHRYQVTVSVGGQTWQTRVGFRTAELRTDADASGTGFVIAVNGEPIYVKGANWIPDNAFLTRLGRDSYLTSVTQAREAGINLLRVWGGGIYESEHFYDVCDELGIMVWQDFLFACAAYSEDEPLRTEVETEARQAVTRLSGRPSLVLWNGNNESIWGYVEWGWRPVLRGRSWGEGYYTEVLPAIVAELDPRTPYSPGSPFSYVQYAHPNDHRNGTMHIWDVWNSRDYAHYRDYPARFVSEFGFQGPPGWSTLTSVVHDSPLDPYGPQMLVHQKAQDGNLKLERGLGEHLPRWRNIDEWHWLTQLNQARAVAFGVEHFRSLYPLNTGAVVWQLNDGWPVISWSAVDYAGIRKPLWYALQRVFADRLLTVQPRADAEGTTLVVVAHNDSAEPWSGELVVARRSTGIGGAVIAEQRVRLQLQPRSAQTVRLWRQVTRPDDPAAELVTASLAGAGTAYGYFVEDTALRLVPTADALQVSVSPDAGGYSVRIDASALVKDALLFPDRLHPSARVASGLVSLLAGESHTFTVTGARLDEVALTRAPVLRCLNDLA